LRYLNNVVEQDYRVIKRRVRASQGFGSLASASRTIEGIEAVKMIRKGQIRWLPKDDIVGKPCLFQASSESRWLPDDP
jgi:transposase-like protein